MSKIRDASTKPTAHTTFDPEKDLVDLKGKVIIVTGGNKGIGLATIRHLLKAKAGKVYLAARDEGRAKAAIELLNDEGLGKEGSDSEVFWHKLDLADPAKTKISAEEFVERESRLDVVINNAGGWLSHEIGKEGVNTQHLVNYIGPYIFTKTLLPLLKKTAQEPDSDVRIVNLSSKVHYQVPAGVQFKTIEDFNVLYSYRPVPSLVRYGNAKLAVILWSRKLQEELLPSESLPNGITVIALHPGVIDTVSAGVPKPFRALVKFLVRNLLGFDDTDFGSQTSVFAAASKQVKDEREKYQAGWGAYLHDAPVPGSVVDPSPAALDDQLKEDLVETTEKLLENLGL
ncbi:NAD(P)-binding protein [Coprinellus micaceus]|uniref:NAD(P)-binding protein n=1 Tax=Coprinellus micaceus TaxID=71717 RepID=A0A4Y7T6Z8_COPMI|nr:NAD(P)-binding protein [Coprinellus micaceus]